MKTNMKLKTLVINLLMINILGSSLVACNGVGGDGSDSNTTTSQAKAISSNDQTEKETEAVNKQASNDRDTTEKQQTEDSSSKSKEASNDGSGGSQHEDILSSIAPLENMELGWGFDTVTNTPINTSVDQTLLFSLEDQSSEDKFMSSINIGTSKYSAYTSYVGGAQSHNKNEQFNISGGAGANYGFYSGSIKAAYASSDSFKNSGSSVTKMAGIKEERKYSLPVDGGETRPQSIYKTNASLMRASKEIRNAIIEIRRAQNPMIKNELIAEFYQSFGTHMISSVTKGYIGVHVVTLTENESSTETGSAISGSGKFSGPGVKGEINSSKEKAEVFKKSNWNFASNTVTYPSMPEVRSSLEAAYSGIDTQMQGMAGVIDLTQLKAGDPPQIKAPEIQAMDVTPSVEDKRAILEEKKLLKAAQFDLIKLKADTEHIRLLIDAKDKGALESQLMESAPFMQRLTLFTPGGKYDELNNVNLKEIERKVVMLAFEAETKARAIIEGDSSTLFKLDRLEEFNEDVNLRNESYKANNNIIAFSNWLKYKAYPNNTQHQPFEDWYEALDLHQVIKYKKQWISDLESRKMIDSREANNLLRGSKANHVKLHKNKFAHNKLKNNSDSKEVATFNFSIVPWATVFPELIPEPFDNSSSILTDKILKPINSFLEDRSYLDLVTKISGDKDLSKMQYNDKKFLSDMQTLVTDVKKALLTNDTDPIMFEGKSYDLDNDDDVDNFAAGLTNYLSSSSMYRSEWYKEVKKMKDAGLISPTGSLLNIDGFSLDNYLVTSGIKISNEKGLDYYNPLKQDNNISKMSIEHVITENISKNNNLVSTFLPIYVNNKGYSSPFRLLASCTNDYCYMTDVGGITKIEYQFDGFTGRMYGVGSFDSNSSSYRAGDAFFTGTNVNFYQNLKPLSDSIMYGLEQYPEKNPMFKLYYGNRGVIAGATLVRLLYGNK